MRWEAVKRAVLRRVKLDEEEKDVDEQQQDGSVWTRLARSTRCDKYELPGLYAFCHDETFFRFSSRRSEPLREHVGMRKYKVHRSNPIHSHTGLIRAHPNLACAASSSLMSNAYFYSASLVISFLLHTISTALDHPRYQSQTISNDLMPNLTPRSISACAGPLGA